MNLVRSRGAICLLALGCAMRGAAPLPAGQPSGSTTRAIEDDELARRLREAALGNDAESILQRIIRSMTESRDLLRDSYDPGERTQSVQRTVIADLDDAIRQTLAAMSKKSASSQPAPGDRRDKGKRSATQPSGKDGRNAQARPAERQASDGDGRRTAANGRLRTGAPGGDIRETGREWGNLPPRDREEVIQGIGDDSLPKYRELIEAYYRALAEQADQ